MDTLSFTTVTDSSQAFLASLRRRNVAPATIKRWSPELWKFGQWAGERLPGEISPIEIELGYLAWWELRFRQKNGRAPSAQSQRAAIQALSSLYAFLDKFDVLKDAHGNRARNPMKAIDPPKIVEKQIEWLRGEEDDRFLRAAVSPQERILAYFLRMTGMRLNEALTLLNVDVDLANNTVHVRVSKTARGIRQVPISAELRLHIQAWTNYCRDRGTYHPNGPFLVTRNRTAMKPQYVETAVKRVAVRADLARHVTPHTLRRTFGSDLLNRRVRLETVSKLLGHSSTAVTEKSYAQLLDRVVREELFSALSGWTA